MKYYVSLAALLLVTLFTKAQHIQQTIYSKVYFEADKAQFEKLNTLMVFEHLASKDHGYVGDFDSTETHTLLHNASNVKILIPDVGRYYEQRAQDDLKKNPGPKSGSTKKTRAGVPAHYHGGSMGGFMTLSQMQQNLDSMNLLYPNLISAKQLLGNTLENRPIYVYKMSDNHAINEAQEHKSLYTALHHAREPQSAAQLIYFMWYLLENYNTSDSVIKHLIDDRELYFIPVLNPDGYAYNETTNPNGGGMWRKNRKNNGGNTYGVDLNRNYSNFWGIDNVGSSPNPSSDTYRGTAGFSENETQIVRDFTNSKSFKVCLNYHAHGDWFIYPWGYANLTCADDTTFQMVADILTKENQYISGNCYQTLNYLSNGSSDDWMYGEQVSKPKIFAITPEVGDANDGFWPQPSNIIPLCQENLFQNIMAAWMSGPYIQHERQGLYTFPSVNISLQFNYKNYGLDTCLQLKSWFVSSNTWILQNTDTVVLINVITHEANNDNLSITMKNITPNNTIVSGRLYTKYNNFLYSDTASFQVKNAVGINESASDNQIHIAPNPSSGMFGIDFETIQSDVSVSVYNMTGTKILSEKHSGKKSVLLDLSAQAKGIYLLEVMHEHQISKHKILRY